MSATGAGSLPPSARTPEADLRGKERQEGWAVPLDRIDAFTMGAALSVEPDRIQQELLALWRKAAERAQREGARFAVARACLWNLIVHAEGESEFQETKHLLDEVSETVPARTLALHETLQQEDDAGVIGDDGAPLRAFVEANFRRTSSGRREVVAEEITLESSRLLSDRLPGLVRALLLPDVPTALLMRNPAAETAWLPRLAPEVDRFLFDSGRLTSGAELLQVARALRRFFPESTQRSDSAAPAHGGPKPVELADLGWLRLWPWRALIASLFDAPHDAAVLPKLDSIEIQHVPGAAPAALLLAGWLMDRLRLRRPIVGTQGGTQGGAQGTQAGSQTGSLATGEVVLVRQTPGGRPSARSLGREPKLRLRLVEIPERQAPAGIGAVTLRAGEVTYEALGGTVEDCRCVTLRGPQSPERVQPVHGRRDSELMVAAMGVGGRDPLMYEALRLGTALLHDPLHPDQPAEQRPGEASTSPRPQGPRPLSTSPSDR